MGSLGFVNAIFLAAVACGLIPLIIHLIERDRIQHVIFGSVRFLRNVSRQIIRRHRMAELILLLMRMAIMALIAVAFARPFLWPSSAGATGSVSPGSTRAVLLLIDNSASMSVGGRLEKAKEKALAEIDALGDAGRFAVASFGEQMRLLCSFKETADDARKAVQAIEKGYEGTDLPGVLKQAQEIVAASNELHREVLLLGDLHRSAWESYRGDLRYAKEIDLRIEDVAPEPVANTAVQDLAWPLRAVAGPTPRMFSGRVANFGAEAKKDMKLTMYVGEEAVETQKVSLKPDSFMAIKFRRTFEKPGLVTGRVVLESKDDMPGDNVCHFALHVVPKIGVLLVNGQYGAAPERNDGYFLKRALAPTADSPCEVTEVPPDKFSASLLSEVGVVFLANVGSATGEAVGALKAFVERGGGAVFFPGNKVEPGTFNAAFGDILPCKLQSLVDVQQGNRLAEGVAIGEVDMSHEIFRTFAAPHHGDFGGIRFLKYFQVKDSQASAVLARFEDNKPAVIEKAFGAGYSLLIPTSTSIEWGDLSLKAVFLPLVHQIVGHLTSSGGTACQSVRVGQRAAMEVARGTGDATLTTPPGSAVKLAVKDAADGQKGSEAYQVIEFAPDLPGIYRVTPGGKEFAVAANLDPKEADPRKQKADEILTALTGKAGEGATPAGAISIVAEANEAEAVESRQRFAWYILAATLALLVGEMILAHKTARR